MKKLLILLFVLFLIGCSKSGSTESMLNDAEVALLHLGVYEDAPIEVESIKYFHITATISEELVDELGVESLDTYAFYIAYKVEGSSTTKYAFVATLDGKIDGHEEFLNLGAFEADYENTLEQLEESKNDTDFLEVYLDFEYSVGEINDEYFSRLEPDQDAIDNAPSIFDDAITLVFNTNTTVTFTSTIEERVYKFIPSETGSYTIFSTNDDDAYVELYDENKIKLDEADDTFDSYSFSLTYTLTEGKTYYFVVGDYDGDDSYTIKIIAGQPVVVDPFDDVIVILLNQTKVATIGSLYGSNVVFSFTPSTSGNYTFYSEGADNIETHDSYVNLYNSSKLLLSDDDDSGTGANFSLTYYLTAGQTYYYEVGAYNNNISFNVTIIAD